MPEQPDFNKKIQSLAFYHYLGLHDLTQNLCFPTGALMRYVKCRINKGKNICGVYGSHVCLQKVYNLCKKKIN